MADERDSKSARERVAENSAGRRSGPPRRRADQLIVGRLQEHGHANYQFRADEDLSYYVKLQTDRGERVIWGKDLERAIMSSVSGPKVGDVIGAQRIGRKAVTVVERKRDAAGQIISQSEQHAHRTEWRVEKVKFFADRAKLARQIRDAHTDAREAVRAHPELKSTFLSMRAAEELAARRISDPKDRERFLELVRGAIAGSISKGEPLPQVRLREQPRAAPKEKHPASQNREDPPAR